MADPQSGSARVLVVAGDRGRGRDLADRLRRMGYAPLEPVGLGDGDMDRLARQAPDVILVLAADGQDRAEALGAAAAVGRRYGLPLLLLTEPLDRAGLDRAAAAGAWGCLPASASDETLLAGLDMAWRHRAASDGDEAALRHSLDHLLRSLEQTIHALAVTSEIRDPFTAGHQQRVSWLAEAIARELDLSEGCQQGVRLAGLVHDIGKIHVPSEILAKTGRLSSLEMHIVRGHCAVGYEILKDVPFPWPVARMVLEHHERLDGSGYPAGLAGADTLLESRILAVADVVEAMTAHRPYRAALSMAQALEEIRAKRDRLYDPDVVDACLLLCGEGGCFTASRLIPGSK